MEDKNDDQARTEGVGRQLKSRRDKLCTNVDLPFEPDTKKQVSGTDTRS